MSDADGRYLDNTWMARTVRRSKTPMFNYDALWLTQWNLNTVLGLAYRDVYKDLVDSQLQMYRDGGLLPRGPVAGDDSFVMTSSPVSSFIAGAINKGIDVDEDLAYEAMLDAQSLGGLFDKAPYEYATWGENKGGMRAYLDKGYVPFDLHNEWRSRGAGETLEFAFQDWTLAQIARRLGKRGINVAQFATVSASSGDAERAVDGRPARSGDVRWVATDDQPWVQLDWDTPQRVKRIVLTDPGTLRFSDGTSLRASGTVKLDKTVSWVRFEGPALGDIEVYDDRDAAAYLEQRSRNWRNLFDPSTGFIRPKGSDGSWLPDFDPLAETDFVEANAWQATWFTSHDVMGLANLLGGRKAYADKLNRAFELSEDGGFIGEGQNGLEGAYVSYGNQPGLQVGHLFNYVGYPWLTQHWVRKVKERVYSATTTTDGYGHHDEDQGQMGSISALMAMGLFEVTGGGLQRPGLRPHVADLRRDPAPGRHDQHARGRRVHPVRAAQRPPARQGLALPGPAARPARHRARAAAEQAVGRRRAPALGVHRGAAGVRDRHRDRRARGHQGALRLDAGARPVHPREHVLPAGGLDRHRARRLADHQGEHRLRRCPHRQRRGGGSAVDGNRGRRPRGDGAQAPHHRPRPAAAARQRRALAGRGRDGIIGVQRRLRRGQGPRRHHRPVGRRRVGLARRAGAVGRADLAGADPGRPDRALRPLDLRGRQRRDVDVPGRQLGRRGRHPAGRRRRRRCASSMKTFDRVRFQVRGGTGPNVGLSELEVYAVPSVPDAPTDVRVDGDTVSWKAPAFDGGAPLTGYVITPEGGEPIVVDETHTSVRAQGTKFSVRARNLMGEGPEATS